MTDGSLSGRPSQPGETVAVPSGDVVVRQSSSSVSLELWSTVVMLATSLPRRRPDPPLWGFVTFGATVVQSAARSRFGSSPVTLAGASGVGRSLYVESHEGH